MPNNVRVDWYQNDVMLRVENASAEMMLAIAFQIEAIAKTKAPVDTGFMRSSSYVVGVNTNTFRQVSKDGKETVDAPEPAPPGGATVGFAANYTIHVEETQPFVYPAVLAVQSQVQGIVETVGRREFQ